MMGSDIYSDDEAITVTRESVIHAAMIRAAFLAAREFDHTERILGMVGASENSVRWVAPDDTEGGAE